MTFSYQLGVRFSGFVVLIDKLNEVGSHEM